MVDFKLRPFKESDLELLVKYANNKKVADNLTDSFPHPYSVENGKNFIKMATSIEPNHLLAIEVDGEFGGGIGVHQKEDIERLNAELGYWLAEHHWGKGIISKAIPQMIEYGFKNFDFNRIYARPYPHNIASIRALEKSGFILEARIENSLVKNDEIMDELIYAVRRAN